MDRVSQIWIVVAAVVLISFNPDRLAAQSSGSRRISAKSDKAHSGTAGKSFPVTLTSSTDPLVSQDRKTTPEDLPAPISPRSEVREADEPSQNELSPLGGGLKLDAAPLADSDVRFPISLAAALRLSDARPLVVAAAQASVWVAEAQLTRAKVLWFPTLNLGADYTRHDGGGPDFNGGVLTSGHENFLYAGGGLTGATSIADAIYAPLAARQVLNARQIDIQTSKNDVLYKTAEAYFKVHQARGTYAGNLYSVKRAKDLVERIEHLSRDLVTRVEVDRARNMMADIQQRAADSRQDWRVESANLTQILRLDPRAVIVPLEHDHTQITLIDPTRSLDDLMPIAINNRPEIASNQAMVKAAEIAVRQEKARPLIPNVRLNGFQTPSELLQGGFFAIGQGSNLNQGTYRFDFSVQPVWQLDQLGLGNLAKIKVQRGMESQQIIELFKAQDTVAAEVTRAHARLESAAARVFQADRALRTGIITFNGNFEGIQQTTRLGNVLILVNRPQEAVYALQLLDDAFKQYFATVAEYNIAQFELFHALGYPAREVAEMCAPGDQVPVDTMRPGYLPPVENGPPPSTK